MKILAWNCRGLARGLTIRALRASIRSLRPDLIFLSETKVPASRFMHSLVGLGFSDWLEVPHVGLQGGLFLDWKFGVEI
jgi:exonuclease III